MYIHMLDIFRLFTCRQLNIIAAVIQYNTTVCFFPGTAWPLHEHCHQNGAKQTVKH